MISTDRQYENTIFSTAFPTKRKISHRISTVKNAGFCGRFIFSPLMNGNTPEDLRPVTSTLHNT